MEGSHDYDAESKCRTLIEQAHGLLQLRRERVNLAREMAALNSRMSQHEESAAFHALHPSAWLDLPMSLVG